MGLFNKKEPLDPPMTPQQLEKMRRADESAAAVRRARAAAGRDFAARQGKKK